MCAEGTSVARVTGVEGLMLTSCSTGYKSNTSNGVEEAPPPYPPLSHPSFPPSEISTKVLSCPRVGSSGNTLLYSTKWRQDTTAMRAA